MFDTCSVFKDAVHEREKPALKQLRCTAVRIFFSFFFFFKQKNQKKNQGLEERKEREGEERTDSLPLRHRLLSSPLGPREAEYASIRSQERSVSAAGYLQLCGHVHHK